MSPNGRPRLGLLLGDPSGIGPELCARLLAGGSLAGRADVLVIGRPDIWRDGVRIAGAGLDLPVAQGPDRNGEALAIWDAVPGNEEFPRAQANPLSGEYVLKTLDVGAAALSAGHIDALVFAPLNKQAMKMAGLQHEDELRFFQARFGVTAPVSEFNLAAGLWTGRVTSHVALRQVADLITPEAIHNAVRLLNSAMRQAGVEQPRIAVAALNPHAGEGGKMGTEEAEILSPAVAALAGEGVLISGPHPADTVFLRASRGEFDAVVSMYHDQGQIATKLLGFDRGVTYLGGLPYVIATPAHGTAFDIAGRGVANPGAIEQACHVAIEAARRAGAGSETLAIR